LLKNALSNLQTVATDLGSVGDLNKLSITNSNTSAVVAEAGSDSIAVPGNHSLSITQLAQAKRVRSNGFAASTTVVSASQFTVTLGADPITIPAGTTVAGMVATINAAGGAVTARLVNTGVGASPYYVVLEGASGAANTFTAVDTATTTLFSTTLQIAQDAEFNLSGLDMKRSSNVVTDALDGVTLKLNSVTSSAVQLGVSFNATDISAAAQRFVDAYNVLTEFITTATGPVVKDNDLSGTLQNDSSVRVLKATLRSKLTAKSSSASGNATHWSVLGISLNREGVLQLDSAKFKSTFEENPTDVVKALSNNLSEPYLYSGSASGLAGDMAIAAYGMVRSTGVLADVTKAYEGKLSRLETEQSKFDKQIESITARYERQFSALNAVLAEFKATSKRLDSTFNRNNND
jgi:flagellar hook-associated protein 2